MPARGRTSFHKRQKEQQRKERNQEKLARRQHRKDQQPMVSTGADDADATGERNDDAETMDGLPLRDGDAGTV